MAQTFMDFNFFSGVLATEATAELGLALTLGYAFFLIRLEFEHLLFALLSAAVAIQAFGAIWLTWPSRVDPHAASVLVHATLAVAAAFHLHYVLVVAGVPNRRRILVVGYGIAVVYVGLMLSPAIWPAPSMAELRGLHVLHPASPIRRNLFPPLQTLPVALGVSFYAFMLAELAFCSFSLWQAIRGGRRELAPSLLGSLAITVSAVHDITILTLGGGTLYFLSHAFCLYGFFVGLSLLLRYRQLVVGYASTSTSLSQRTEELRKSHADLEQVQRELSSKKQLAAVGELAAAIAHEVRNPLAIIVNAVAGLRRQSLQEEDRHTLLGIVDEETARLNRLVTDLLRFARPVSIRRTSVSLAELVRRAEVGRGTEHKFEITIPDEPHLKTVQADANLLRLVFDNLVSNACQAMPEGGTVRIVVGNGILKEEPCIRIEIVDEGHGMDEAVLSRAVDPFFTTRPSGTGLGLPIVQRIVAAHGGELHIESEPQRGTTVGLLLPILAEAESSAEEPTRN